MRAPGKSIFYLSAAQADKGFGNGPEKQNRCKNYRVNGSPGTAGVEMKKYDETVLQAAYEYICRQERRTHPAGKFDRGGRWYPSETEEQHCCKVIRNPSRAWPYTLMTHCRSVAHIASLYGVDPKVLRRAIKDGAWEVFRAQEVLQK
jgi:hypothetical protein